MVIKKNFYIISVSVFIVLMAILAIGDLDFTVSEAIINEQSIWARFFDIFGEVPAMAAIIVGITFLYGGRNREKTWWNILSTVIAGIFISVFSFLVYFNIIRYIYHEDVETIGTVAYIIMIILAISTIAISFYYAITKGESFTKFKKHAWLLIILVLGEMIFVNIVKSIWARPRMRSIIDGENEFQHWYQIAGWSNDNELKSFPSGHTANAFVALVLIIFAPYFKSIKVNYYIIGAVVWGTLVALSRVVLGAHFLSDVLVGSYITIFLFILLEKILLRGTNHES